MSDGQRRAQPRKSRSSSHAASQHSCSELLPNHLKVELIVFGHPPDREQRGSQAPLPQGKTNGTHVPDQTGGRPRLLNRVRDLAARDRYGLTAV